MSLICSLSSEPCQEPVITKNGDVYERHLIEKHIAANGTDPITKQALSIEDLIPVKVLPNPAMIRPKTANQQGIPAMLQSFQTEWDALMLEVFTLRQQLTASQQELSHAMYQQDAACRVIARIMKERDALKKELSDLKASGYVSSSTSQSAQASSNGMEVDSAPVLGGLPSNLKARIDEKKQILSDARTTRKIGPEVSTRDQVSSFKVSHTHNTIHKATPPGVLCIDIHSTQQNLIVTGGVDKAVVIFDTASNSKLATLTGHSKPVRAVKFIPEHSQIASGDDSGTVIVWAQNEKNHKWEQKHVIQTHKQPISQIDLHPIGNLLLVSSQDETFSLIDSITAESWTHKDAEKLQKAITCAKFHPDGEIMATGNADHRIQVWDVKTFAHLASFEGHTDKVNDVCFSENGYTLASASDDKTIRLWDLQEIGTAKTVQLDVVPKRISYDLSGRFLAAACGNEIRIFTGKNADLVATFQENSKEVTGIQWGANAKWLAGVSLDRSLKIWSL